MSHSYDFKNQEMIYISGWGEWGRVLNQTEQDVQIYVYGSPSKWYSKKSIIQVMNQKEELCEE